MQFLNGFENLPLFEYSHVIGLIKFWNDLNLREHTSKKNPFYMNFVPIILYDSIT